jgi:hypothetical protein
VFVLLIVAISLAVRRADALHGDIIDLRSKPEMVGNVEPAHPLPKTKINNHIGFHARTGGEIENHRELLVVHRIVRFVVYDPGFRHTIVVSYGKIKALQPAVRDG